jgi:hypothetical protein
LSLCPYAVLILSTSRLITVFAPEEELLGTHQLPHLYAVIPTKEMRSISFFTYAKALSPGLTFLERFYFSIVRSCGLEGDELLLAKIRRIGKERAKLLKTRPVKAFPWQPNRQY